MSLARVTRTMADVLANGLKTMTDALQLPKGTTAQRPATPVAGMVRYNTTTSKIEAREGSSWVNLVGAENDADIAAIAALTGTGIPCRTADDTWAIRSVAITANQLAVTNPAGVAGNITLAIASNPVLPGTGSVTVPVGDTSQRPVTPVEGMIRYNSQTDELEVYKASDWKTVTTSA